MKTRATAMTKDSRSLGKEQPIDRRAAFAAADPFNDAPLEAALKATATELGVKASVRVHPVRLSCNGNYSGPRFYRLLEVMGKEKVMGRIERALAAFG